MRLEHSFTVPVPVDTAWDALLDLPRVVPCMPGATLTGVEGDTFTGTVKVKLGPIGLTYQGKGRFDARDEAARRVVIEASGRDTRSAGTASATVTADLTARPAQFGRGRLSAVAAKLIGQFAACLAETLTGPPAAPVPSAQPVPSAAAAADVEGPAPAVEPIDLLRMTAGTATARRLATYALAAVLALLRWRGLRRRRRR